nr:neuronal acetylcholine receptor subunit alpha-10-like isoform X1 [Lytechinus pictus]
MLHGHHESQHANGCYWKAVKMSPACSIVLKCVFLICFVSWYLIAVQASDRTDCSSPNTTTTEKELVSRLLSNYGDTSVRPVKNHTKPVEVFFRMLLYELVKLDETMQLITIRTNMRLQWVDEYLQWDPEENGGIYNLTLKMHQVWRPDVVLDEDIDRNFISLPEAETYVIVQYTGAMDWLFPAITTSACKMNIQYYPFDVQKCVLTFYPWTLDESKMRFFAKDDVDASQARYVKNGIWSLVDFTATNRSIKYLCCPYPNDHLEYQLTFQRESGFFLTNVVVPAVFLTALMLVGFWLHPDSGEKVTFTVTNLLALTLFQQLVADKMPPIGEPRSILVTCFFMLIILSGCAVFLSVIVLRLYHHDTNTKPPRWVIKLFLPWFSRSGTRSYIRKLYILQENKVTRNEEVITNGNTASTILDTELRTEEFRRPAVDLESKDVNQFIWRQLALAFDSFCGTILCLAMIGNVMFALISFLK